MKNIKIVFLMLIIFILLACSNENAADSSNSPTELKLNLAVAESDPTYPLWEEFAEDIEEASEGTLKVEIYSSESLGDTSNMIEKISQGTPVLQDSDPSHLSDYVDDFTIFMHPYLFKEPEDIQKAWESNTGKELSEELEEKGLRVVSASYFGTRHLMSDKEIVTRDDVKGMKIRNAPTTMWNETSKTLGGSPTETDLSEAYSALSQGVADAIESPLSLLYSNKYYEVKDHVSLTEHLVAPTTIVMSQDVYESLPSEGQEALDKVGHEMPDQRIGDIEQIEEEYKEKLEEEGVKFNKVEKEEFIEASKNVSDAFPEWSPNLYEDMEEELGYK